MNSIKDLPPVGEIRTLGAEHWADEPTARETLTRAVRTCYPLMRRRGWRVPLVDEFFPKNPGLMGLNIGGGARIRIRLRRAGSGGNSSGFAVLAPRGREQQQQPKKKLNQDGGFLPFDYVLGTMLHELVHIVRGPHDAVFYKLLDEITAEVEADIASGAADAANVVNAFDGPGRRLGSGPVANLPRGVSPIVTQQQARDAAARAADKRLGLSGLGLQGSGPRRLGGSGENASFGGIPLTAREAAAQAAARRAADEKSCGREGDVIDLIGDEVYDAGEVEPSTADGRSAQHEQQTAAAEIKDEPTDAASREAVQVLDVIDLSDSPSPSARKRQPPSSSFGVEQEQQGANVEKELKRSKPSAHSTSVAASSPAGNDWLSWACRACTLNNPPAALECQVCGSARDSWTCAHCTLVNDASTRTCSACGA